MDTPKETNGDEATKDDPSEIKTKHGRRRRRSKFRHSKTGPGDENNLDGIEEEYDPDQPAFEQAEQEDEQISPEEQATDVYPEEDNYMPPSEDEISLGDDEFGVPEDPVEHERFKHRLIATARSLKKKQQQLQVDQDVLTDRWTEVLAAEEYDSSANRLTGHPVARINRISARIPARTPTPLHYGPGQQARPARYSGKQSRTAKIDLRITGARPSARR